MDRADILLLGGSVVDGTGREAFRADVAMRGDRIVAVGDLAGWQAGRAVDVAGKMVAPGFIDVHTHDDRALISMPDMTPKVSQGVTTVVAGNCGVSLAPLVLSGWPPAPLDLMGDEKEFRFERFGDYVAALRSAPPAVNAVLLVGHTTLRHRCMAGNVDRPADARETSAMCGEVEAAMHAGAWGLSTGLDYPGAKSAPTDEIVALAEIAAQYGGLYATHTRDYFDKVEEAIEEAFLIGRRAKMPVILSHHQATGPHNYGRCRHTLALVEGAMDGLEIGLDAYPYAATSTVIKPERCLPEIRIVISWSNPHPEMTGRELSDIARDWDCPLREAAERLRPGGAVYFQLSEDDVRRVLAFPHTMIGSDGMPSDRLPHPRLWGTFPRVLGYYARELKLFSLEEAVRRMTGLTAERLGLVERGRIAVGAFADVTVFDPATVIDRATFLAPIQASEGILHVFVNGEEVWADGRSTGTRPGRVLERNQRAS